MNKSEPTWLITVASWEERFLAGTKRLIDQRGLSTATVFYYTENREWTESNLKLVTEDLKNRNVAINEIPISFGDPVSAWHQVEAEIRSNEKRSLIPLLDITTIPRDTLWTVLSVLQRDRGNVSFAYHRPIEYADWLSKDPGRPRLVYKLSGVATLGRPTCLIVATGFDPERTRQLMWYFEPRYVLLGFQTGDQFGNDEKNIARHRKTLKDEYDEFAIKEFQLDAYSSDHGLSQLEAAVAEFAPKCNVVMTSLGPKLGAIAMYEVHCRFPETSLAYTPSREFNREYSKGIKETFEGVVGQ